MHIIELWHFLGRKRPKKLKDRPRPHLHWPQKETFSCGRSPLEKYSMRSSGLSCESCSRHNLSWWQTLFQGQGEVPPFSFFLSLKYTIFLIWNKSIFVSVLFHFYKNILFYLFQSGFFKFRNIFCRGIKCHNLWFPQQI